MSRGVDYYSWDDFTHYSVGRQLIIWGTGLTGEKAFSDLSKDYEIICFADSNTNKDEFCGIKVCSLDQIKDEKQSIILIAHQYVYEAIDWLKANDFDLFFHYETIEYNKTNKHRVCGTLPVKTGKQWISHSCYAHGMGAIDGVCLTNSKEAFLYSYSKGYRVFECDLAYTEAEELILLHLGDPFEYILKNKGDVLYKYAANSINRMSKDGLPYSYKELRMEKLFGVYQPLSFADLLDLMEEYEDIYIIPDMSHMDGARHYNTVIDVVKEKNDDLLDRFIFEINYEEIGEISNLQNKTSRVSYMLIHDHRQYLNNRYTNLELVECAKALNIKLIMVGVPRINQNLIDIAKEKEISIGAYCWIDSEATITKLMDMGIEFFCTESIFVKKKENDSKNFYT